MLKGSQGEILFKNAKLFIEREDVQQVVEKLRDDWNIQRGGFRSDKKYLQWLNELTSQGVTIKRNSKTLKEFEFDFVNDNYFLSSYAERQVLGFENKVTGSSYSVLLGEIAKACKRFKKPPYWRFFLFTYITRGKVKESVKFRSGRTYRTPSIKVIRVQTSNGEERRIRLEFGSHTNLKDIKPIWKNIQKVQKTFPNFEKERTKRKQRRDGYIIKQIKLGKNFKEVYDNLPFNFGHPSEQGLRKAYNRLKEKIKGQ